MNLQCIYKFNLEYFREIYSKINNKQLQNKLNEVLEMSKKFWRYIRNSDSFPEYLDISWNFFMYIQNLIRFLKNVNDTVPGTYEKFLNTVNFFLVFFLSKMRSTYWINVRNIY